MVLDEYPQLQKYLLPSVIALASWLLKNFFVNLYQIKAEQVRKEFLFQLREIYSPLFYWSGVVQFNETRNKDHIGVCELHDILKKSITLIPSEHFLIFARLTEYASGQNVTPIPTHKIDKSRDWVYSQIEMINYLLFRRSGNFNLKDQFTVYGGIGAFSQIAVSTIINLSIWLIFALVLTALYYSIKGNLYVILLTIVIVVLISITEIRRRILFRKVMGKRLKS
jgi:hypothetical protein